MTGGGGWLGSDGDASAELEARWGPTGRSSPPAPARGATASGDGAADANPEGAEIHLLVPAPGADSRRRRGVVAGLVAVVLAALVGAGLVIAAGDDRSGRTVEAASARPTTTIGDDLRESARAFGERWSAGPSTTMPLGAAGVPPEQRPTTTTAAPRQVAQPPRLRAPGNDLGGGGGFETDPSFEEDGPYLEEEWPEPEEEPEPPPKLAADDPRLRGAEEAAQAFVDAFMRRDCDAAWAMLSTPTLEFFAAMEAEGEGSVKEEFCAGLQEEEIPQITVLPPARPHGDGALVDTEAEGEVDPLPMLLEGERWTVDLLAEGE